MDPEVRTKALEHLSSIAIPTLVTGASDGYPTGRRVGFVNSGFVVEIPTQKTSAKLKHIRRYPMVLLTHFDPASFRYTQIKANVEVFEDPDEVWAMRERYVQKYPRVAGTMTPESRQTYVGLRLIPVEVRIEGLLGPMQALKVTGADLT